MTFYEVINVLVQQFRFSTKKQLDKKFSKH